LQCLTGCGAARLAPAATGSLLTEGRAMPTDAKRTIVLSFCLLAAACAKGSQSNEVATADSASRPAAEAARESPSPAPGPPAPLPTNATGCAPGSRCILVTGSGKPSGAGGSVAQCRGKFADFIVPKTTLPAAYAGPWFKPELIENATTNGPAGARPWMSFDPTVESQRLKYLLALRNYAFASRDLRAYTPQLTTDAAYRDPAGGAVAQSFRTQKWYPAPRMIYGNPSAPGTREAARGMTLERTIRRSELAGNTQPFPNYAVAYYDARGANAYRQVWSTATPGKDVANTAAMHLAEGALVYKLLFGAAKPSDFPQDILANSVSANVLPNSGGVAVPVRLLQIDIAVKDNRAGPTGWYFATYAYDRNVQNSSPWRRMVPVGLMWGNDQSSAPLGNAPIKESWINPSAPAYARQHLNVGGRLDGPVDNRESACMSCHSTAQAPSYAPMLPSGTCNPTPLKLNWYRNLSGAQAFGSFDTNAASCKTPTPTPPPVAADYSLQLASTVSRALTAQTFNPCTWDDAQPPPAPPAAPAAAASAARVYPVTRDPTQ
jgi:hypothetical protein